MGGITLRYILRTENSLGAWRGLATSAPEFSGSVGLLSAPTRAYRACGSAAALCLTSAIYTIDSFLPARFLGMHRFSNALDYGTELIQVLSKIPQPMILPTPLCGAPSSFYAATRLTKQSILGQTFRFHAHHVPRTQTRTGEFQRLWL